jgi:regulator of sigma E protease
MKVNRFAIGFPPFIFNRQKDGITYSVGALPIGGMVDIAGLGSEEEMVNTAKGEAPTPQRDTSRPFGQKHYQDANLFWRFMVIFAGPMMNFIFAIVLAIGFFSVVGFPDYSKAPNNRVAETMGGSPAARAGIKSGDLVVGINGVATRDNEKIVKIIRGSLNKPVTLQLQRDGKPIDIRMQPVLRTVPTRDDKSTEKVPGVGIMFEPDSTMVTYKRLSVGEATQRAFIVSTNMTLQVLGLIKRAVTAQLTEVDKASIGGPLKIAKKAGQASREGGLPQSIMMAIGLSMNLGLMNLLPLPALDGGRIMFLGYELVARRPFNPKWEGLVHAAGMLMLLTFMLFITLRDVNAGALIERFTN